jgi:hypothetical protein
MVLRPQSRSTLGSAAIGKRCCMSLLNDRPAACEKGNHLPVANLVGLFVVGFADEKQWPSFGLRLPAGPWATLVAEALLNAEYRHERSIERKRTIEVLDADEDVGEQGRLVAGMEFRRLTFELTCGRQTA